MVFRKHPLIRASHYLFLFPFLPSLPPLLVNYRSTDLIIYIIGFLVITALIVYGNHRPVVHIENRQMALYPHRGRHVEYHRFTDISNYRRNSANRITVYFRKHEPVTLNLKKRDIEELITTFEKENINAQ